ncbi:MAG: hypothetical protein IKL92_07355 [Oscillospiraceae bacterium]|nr:hypothetical protein [Oscillospiraceae bacterium]
MSEKAYKLITVVACLIAISSMFMISNLNDKVESLERQIRNTESMSSSRMNAIISEVDRKLEEYTNFLADSSWTFGKADMENHTVEVMLSVTPKENFPAETLAEIFVNEKGYPMTANGGTYEAYVTLPLFGDALVEKVIFSEENRTRTEKLNWGISPKYDFLPIITANYRGSTHSAQHTTHGVDQVTAGTIEIDLDLYNKKFEMKSAELVETLNGKEVTRTPLSFSETDPDSPHAADISDRKPWDELAAKGEAKYISLYTSTTREYHVPRGGHYEMFVEVTDSHGLIYRCKISSTIIDDNGNFVEDEAWQWWGCEADILSPDREVLFKTEYM